ncbi:MAG: saccharopine dehydrogenase NADP-binding domain-containing protein [Alphaproteobacteria bacterium]|nr:saccharopine dehydrogenase NADP-binding domain-containing protein [Alphaproteobacteria bacterium]
MVNKRILIAGSGGIGRAVALLLRELGQLDVDIILADAYEEQLRSAAEFVGSGRKGNVDTLLLPLEGTSPALEHALDWADLVLDCLPGSLAPRVAGWCLEHRCHYANLTEYVAETERILEMARDAETGFALQCGLAPGFVNVLGMQRYRRFCERFGVTKVDSLKMRVGALTRNAEGPHFYGFTWSPIGVATEYVKDAVVVRDFKQTKVPSLTEIRTLLIDGLAYEEATTSGGAADMPEALAGRVRQLDYKTLRYPGHWEWVRRQLDAIGDVPDRIRQLQERMQSAVPQVSDDLVVIYAAVEGRDKKGQRQRFDEAYKVWPQRFGAQVLRAIQSTTAAGLAECARVLLTGDHRGPLLQSQLDPEDYLSGPYVSAVYHLPLSKQTL